MSAPTLDDYRATVGNADYLAALDLLALSPAVAGHVRAFGGLSWTGRTTHERGRQVPDCDLSWAAVAQDLDDNGVPLSTTETRLLVLVLSLTTGRPMDVRHLAGMGSWADQVAAILERWRLGGYEPGAYVDQAPGPAGEAPGWDY